MLTNLFQSTWKTESAKSKIYEFYTDDKKLKYPSNPKDIFKCATNIYEAIYTKETTSKAATTESLTKTPNKKKIFNEQFNLCETKISLDEIIKSINSQTTGSHGDDGLTAEFYKVSFLMN